MTDSFLSFKQQYGIKLTAQQEKAVKATDGAVLLLAVPGSGKTTVLVTRLGYMIYCLGIPPEKILVMTYTVAAAADMRERFVTLFGNEYADSLRFRTINGLCQSVINFYKNRVSTKQPFELAADEKYLSGLISDIYLRLTGDYAAEAEIKNIRSAIAYVKNMMIPCTDIELPSLNGIPFAEIYEAYNSTLKSRRLMDYDDQMVYTLSIFSKYPRVLGYYRSLYRYICVDEAQDTSKIQHEIIRLLAGENGNIFMVGDEDQSIYGFRAAYPQALLGFEKIYKNPEILYIEQNFRSDENIVRAANRFIRGNKQRRPKEMLAARPAERRIKKVTLINARAQYSYLLKLARDPKAQTAVLYRENESALPLVDMLERENIPYSIKCGDFAFFGSRTVRDIRDIITFALDRSKTECFVRVYPKLGLYIKKENVLAAQRLADETGADIISVLLKADISESSLSALAKLRLQLLYLPDDTAPSALRRIRNEIGYGLYPGIYSIDSRKLQIIEILAKNVADIRELLKRLDELDGILRNRTSDGSAEFILSTIHSAKGLEFDNVILIDAHNGILPRDEDEDDGLLEEDRRLFYVAATRAKKQLTVFELQNERSLFIDEFFKEEPQSSPEAKSNQPKGLEPVTPKNKPKPGEIIYHHTFGKGEVISVDGDVITVAFRSGSVKKLSLNIVMSQQLICRYTGE